MLCHHLFVPVLALSAIPVAHGAGSLRNLLDAIREVESGSAARYNAIVGDDGRSLGPYQIQRCYWRDSDIDGHYAEVRKAAYAERVMLAYWKRYCPQALARGDWQTLARVHNGGPLGNRRSGTLDYWQKVSRAMDR